MTHALIMAGGRGLRLHPITAKTPKPLLKVGDKPLLERIIERLRDGDVRDITIATHYLAEQIEGYFGDGSAWGVSIAYIRETEPLGTAGAVSKMRTDDPFIVCNADIVADLDFDDLMAFHNLHEADATMAVALYQHQVPFGVVQTDEIGLVAGIREKPIENFTVAAGVYVLPPSVTSLSGKVDMPDLLGSLTVMAYPIRGYWCDVGRFESLAQAHIDWTLRQT